MLSPPLFYMGSGTNKLITKNLKANKFVREKLRSGYRIAISHKTSKAKFKAFSSSG